MTREVPRNQRVLPTMVVLLFLLCCNLKQLSSSAFMIQSKNNIPAVTGGTTTGTLFTKKPPFSYSKSFRNSQVTSVTTEVLETLEKKLNGQSLTNEQKNAAIKALDSLLEHLNELENNDAAQNNIDNTPHSYNDDQLLTAVSELDVDAVNNMLQAGLQMNQEMTEKAFWAVVDEVDRSEAEDLPLAANVTQMLHHIFDADIRLLQTREKQSTNITCMQPDDSGGLEASARRMNYVFDDGDHKNIPLKEGRCCEGGNCCDKCSRNIFPTFALEEESDINTFPELVSLTFNNLEKVSAATIIQFVRLIERVRRTIANEYGLPLSTILPLQAYSRKYVAGTTQRGGGGGEGDFVTLHTDEATHSGYHYSCVLYLSTQGKDFEGGSFVFNDPEKKEKKEINEDKKEYSDEIDAALLEALKKGELPEDLVIGGEEDDDEEHSAIALEEEIRRAGRVLTPYHPTRGAAVIFSSGWENMHEVEKITSGVRYAVPAFFTTCPVPDAAYEQMKVGKPKTDEDIADDWLHLLLAHRKEEPMESVGRVKELLMKWHYLCTPLSQH